MRIFESTKYSIQIARLEIRCIHVKTSDGSELGLGDFFTTDHVFSEKYKIYGSAKLFWMLISVFGEGNIFFFVEIDKQYFGKKCRQKNLLITKIFDKKLVIEKDEYYFIEEAMFPFELCNLRFCRCSISKLYVLGFSNWFCKLRRESSFGYEIINAALRVRRT